jgi:hypothetical protein
MNDAPLATYLNDHLAGSVVALEILKHLADSHPDPDQQAFAAALRAEILADKEELSRLVQEFQLQESQTRQALGWITEKLSRVKMHLEDTTGGEFLLFEYLEALSLGIEGKFVLWTTLSTIDPSVERAPLYQRLMARAKDQRNRVDERRLTMARRTLTVPR